MASATVGRAVLIFAFAVALWGIAASLTGARTNRRELVVSGRRAMYTVAGLAIVAMAILEAAFLRSDFHFTTVAQHSSTTTPTFYRAAATWSSQEGSLLLWLLLLSLWSSLVLFLTRKKLRDVVPYATAVLCGFAAFFSALLIFKATPFATVASAPADGIGLSPLLRHPSMMIHPPMLYSGYTLFTIPFAFAVGALIVRRVDAEWIASTRRFALAAWLFLGIGIILGARWSYTELGWGGYWAWDPVENASLLPWLTGTAFLHSIMLQERRGMLKVWNTSLILGTGTLAILGTFLVRSGILDSIHAFGASTLGGWFVVLIALMVVGCVTLVVSRRDALRSENRIDALLSREAIFLFNNLVLVALAFVILFLTFFPLISEALTGQKRAIGPPLFNQFTVPLALVLVLLSGIGPVIAWRRASWRSVRRAFAVPVASAVIVGVASAPFGSFDTPFAGLMFMFGAFVVGTVAQEVVRGTRARRAMTGGNVLSAAYTLVARNRRRFGGYTVHIGMAALFIGIAASTAFQHAKDVRLTTGQSAMVDGYKVTYLKPTSRVVVANGNLERLDFGAQLRVTKDGKSYVTNTTRGYYPSSGPVLGPVGRFFLGDSTSEVALHAGPFKDLWIAESPDLTNVLKLVDQGDKAFEKDGAKLTPEQFSVALGTALRGLTTGYTQNPPAATFRVLASPMVTWIWVGAIIVFGGGLIALWPAPDAFRRRLRAGYAGRVARDLGRA